MKPISKNILRMAGIGMDICWLYAWAAFLMFAIYRQYWSFQITILIGGTAAVVALGLREKKWRRLYAMLFRLCFFFPVFLIVLHQHNPAQLPFIHFAWIANLVSTLKTPGQWFQLSLLLSLTLAIWKTNSVHTLDSLTPEKLYRRFDTGIAAILTLLVIKSLLMVKGGIYIPHPRIEVFFLAYFLLGLFVIVSVRNVKDARKDYIPGFGRIGIVLSSTVVVLLAAAFLFVLFYTYLATGADRFSDQIKTAAIPLLPLLKSVFRFILMHDQDSQPGDMLSMESGKNDISMAAQAEQDIHIVGTIIKWLPTAIILIIILIIVAAGIRLLFQFLLYRSPERQEEIDRHWALRWLHQFKALFHKIRMHVFIMVKGYASGTDMFSALITWGRRSGVTRRRIETPREYSERLVRSFPALKQEITVILSLFQKECYAECILNPTEMQTGQAALNQMKQIAHLPRRLKAWFISRDR